MKPHPFKDSWLGQAVMFLVGCIAATMLSGILCHSLKCLECLECRIRSAGGVFQLLGVGSVALGIYYLRKDFDSPSVFFEIEREAKTLFKAVSRRLNSLLRRRSSKNIVAATGTGAMEMTGYSSGVSGPDRTLPISELIAVVEQRILNVERQANRIENDLMQKIGSVKEGIDGEIDRVRKELMDTVRSVSIGGVRLQVTGVVWLTLGVIMTTWPQNIALLVASRVLGKTL